MAEESGADDLLLKEVFMLYNLLDSTLERLRLVCRFFFAISAFNAQPRSESTFFPLKISLACIASSTERNLAKPI